MTTDPNAINVQEEFSKKLTVHTSLDQEVIVTTSDKVRLCLIAHKDLLIAKREWLLPLGILVTLVASLIAASFRSFILDAAVWGAIFVLAAFITGGWLIVTSIKAFRSRGGGDVEGIIERLKAHSPELNVEED